MTQTSKTKSVTISLLKHLNGNPLGTTITLLGLCAVCKVLVIVASHPPSRTHVTYTFAAIHSVVLLLEVGGTPPNSLK